MLGRPQSRKDAQPALPDNIIVVSLAHLHTAHLHGFHSTPCNPIFAWHLLHRDYAMHDAVELHIAGADCPIVQQEDRRIPAFQVMFESKNLSTIDDWFPRQHSQFSERIDDKPLWRESFDLAQYRLRRIRQFHV